MWKSQMPNELLTKIPPKSGCSLGTGNQAELHPTLLGRGSLGAWSGHLAVLPAWALPVRHLLFSGFCPQSLAEVG